MIQWEGRVERARNLRKQAQELAKGNAPPVPVEIEAPSPEECRRLISELRVHQVELELQNQELREAEVALEAAHARFFDLYELAPVGYCTISGSGLVAEANLTLAGLLGLARSDLLNQRFTRFVFKQDQDLYYIHSRKLSRCADPQTCELRLVKQNGTPIWARLESTITWDEKGAPLFRLTVSDISERMRELAEREAVQQQLYHLQKQDSIGRLAGGVAHDFNNMLSVILGFTELAMNRLKPGDPVRRDLQEVLKAARHSAEVTRQLLAYARKQTVTPKVLDLNLALDGMLSMLRRLLGENLVLAWHPCADPWLVNIDPCQVDQILTNLCINARDAIVDTGTVTIETGRASYDAASCARQPGYLPGDFMRMSVTDDGLGMDPDVLKNVFEPFYTTKTASKGTGLGLATVHGIVRQNDGFIIVRSKPERGTTLDIYLPRFEGGHGQAPHAIPAPTPAQSRETVLLVEDEVAALKLFKVMLDELGYHVLIAITPGEALEVAARHTGVIDVLLTDVVMPEMNGNELARQVLVLHPELKRIFMSGYTADIIAHQGVLAEGVHFIQKPFNMAELDIKLRVVLDA